MRINKLKNTNESNQQSIIILKLTKLLLKVYNQTDCKPHYKILDKEISNLKHHNNER